MTDEANDKAKPGKPEKDKPQPLRSGGKTKRVAIRTALVLLPLLLLVLLLPVCGCARTITGKVIDVSDGDTITVLDDQKRQHKICLNWIDAPESSQDWGSRAKQSLSDLVFGKTVTVVSAKRDRYGRVLGKVTLDGKNVNLEQVNRGMAWFYRLFATELSREDARAYEQAEASARKEGRGMWADGKQIPPWDYRRGGRPVKAPFWETPPTTGGIIGNRASRVYHLSVCPGYKRVAERNRVTFKTEAEARAAGYRKAVDCLW